MNILSIISLGLIKPKPSPFKDEYYNPIVERRAQVYINGDLSKVDFTKPKKARVEYRPDYTYSS